MRLFLLALTFPALLLAQGRDPFLGVTEFRGTVTFNATASGPGLAGGRYSMSASVVATFLLTRTRSNTPTWTGRFLTSSSSFSWDGTGSLGECSVTEKFTIQGPLRTPYPDDPEDIGIRLNRDVWELFVAAYLGPRQSIERTITCPAGGSRIERYQAQLVVPPSIPGLPFPSSGTTLNHRGQVENQSSFGTYILAPAIQWSYTISISPNDGDLRLELTSAQYPNWRPSAQKDGSPGPSLDVTATVLNAKGEPAPLDVMSFEWELVDTSKEPGIAMNWPIDAKPDEHFDLRFEPQGEQIPVSDEKQKMIRLVRNTASDTARIVPYDWGGWSTLKVTAVLRDGKRLTGRLKDAREDDLRLPMRQPTSFIADVWLRQARASGKPDDADDENIPMGDGNAGDGLTLYEEYRGFYEKGKHIEGKPALKDYFAVNKGSGRIHAGLEHFGKVTGLAVHHRLKEDEITPKRVVNGNTSRAPHRVDQHAVIFVNDDNPKSIASYAYGGPSTPKDISRVTILTSIPRKPSLKPSVDLFAATVAHEAGHTVNIYHHGGGDSWAVLWKPDEGDQRLYEYWPGKERTAIRVLDESGRDETLVWELVAVGTSIHIGVENGQHSGVEDCFMRYDSASAYISKRDPSVRYLVPDSGEPVGADLCTKAEGTGVNAPSRATPQPRYFDAKVGNCRSQILVNDAVTPPKR